MSLSDRILSFIQQLDVSAIKLPDGISMIDIYQDEQVMAIAETFYQKFYKDDQKRFLILGINPGRFGGGVTGIPFTDPKRLIAECKIDFFGKITHEPSSVFVYEMINAYGGVEAFYKNYYINSLFPIALTTMDAKSKQKNYNYYDSPELQLSLQDFIVENIRKQIGLGVYTDVCFCFGTGKNEAVLRKLNEQHHFFKKIIALEHPRFIMQYKNKYKQDYIHKYLAAFTAAEQSVKL
ncbi:MAG TPA: uracil-DNA glycosylase family protein [Mucilaginibacter sp.]|jgi:hypothetical protein|nr:uracil-DNA glycosylase family protein [Mucilaginibacter sp.]